MQQIGASELGSDAGYGIQVACGRYATAAIAENHRKHEPKAWHSGRPSTPRVGSGRLAPWSMVFCEQPAVEIALAILIQLAATASLIANARSDLAEIRRASLATMGSIQLYSGAYQQGYQALRKAFADDFSATQANEMAKTSPPVLTWPGSTVALADFALAQLIVGEFEPGLTSLNSA